MTGNQTVTVYMHPECHLCAEAIARLERLALAWGFRLEPIDIYQDEALLARYFERVPVVVVEGEEVCELHLDEAALAARLGSVGGLPEEESAGNPLECSGW